MSNYDKMSEAASKRFLTLDQEQMISKLGLQSSETVIMIPFTDKWYCIDRKTGFIYRYGNPSCPAPEQFIQSSAGSAGERAGFSEVLSIFDLMERAPSHPVMSGEWVSLSSLASRAGAAPTDLSRFAVRLDAELGGRKDGISLLSAACSHMGGVPKETGDVSFLLPIFGDLKVWFQYWEADEEFPASVQFLWDKNTGLYFHYETLWYIMEHLLTEMLEFCKS